MSQDFDADLRGRLRDAALPPAPAGLHDRVVTVTRDLRSGAEPRSSAGRTRLIMPLAAALAVGVIAISGWGSRPRPTDQSTGPGLSGSIDGSLGPAVAALAIESRIGERCHQIGLCEYHVSLTGPGGVWVGQLDNAELATATGVSPRLPVLLSPGVYELNAEIQLFGDGIPEGATGPPYLGTIGTCSAEFTVAPETTTVQATLGFWLDRCSAGAIVSGPTSALSEFGLLPSFTGDCGQFGCEYRVRLVASAGSWQTILRTPKLRDEVVTGSGLPAALPPGSYIVEASSHRMSDEPSPGSGHRREESVAATCGAQVVIATDTGTVNASVSFDAETCSVSIETAARATDAPESPADPETPRIVCADDMDVPGLRLTCQQAVEAALAHLAAIGEDPPRSSRVEFSHGCRDVSGVAVDCAAQLSGYVNVYSVSPDRLAPLSEGHGQTHVLFVQGNGRSATAELLYSQGFQVFCKETEPTALDCAVIVDAALRYGEFGLNPGPVASIDVYRFCDTTCDPAFKSVLVDVHLSSEIGTVELTVYPTPQGPGVQQLDSVLPRFRPPYGEEPPRELATPIEAVALRHERTDALQDLYLLTVEFYGNGCLERYQPWVDVTADRVRLAIVALPDVRPKPSGALCAMAVYVYTYQLELPKPFEGTIVEDLSNGRTFEVETYVTQPAPT